VPDDVEALIAHMTVGTGAEGEIASKSESGPFSPPIAAIELLCQGGLLGPFRRSRARLPSVRMNDRRLACA
jgi:hypothetical protein